MSIKNLDRQVNNEIEMKTAFLNAMNSGNEEEMAQAFTQFANTIQQNIIQEAKAAFGEDLTDRQVMANRGLQVLTSEETTYYNEVIAGQGFAGVEKLVPSTVIERVFEYLEETHELLQYIDFVNVTGISEWIVKKGEVPSAWWGKLTDAIKEVMDDGFEKLKMEQYKLSAYIPVANAMLDLGPIWLDRYIRTVLAEAMAISLEQAIISGTGADQPIGMVKDLNGAVTNGVYTDKAPTLLPSFEPVELGKNVMAPLTKNGKRTVNQVLLVVNPLDYWSKVFPATTYLTQNGTYVYGVLPIPAKVVQSVAVPAGKMVAGVASDYFMGVGAQRKVESSKEYKFLEDETVYLTKMYANGRPKDNSSFLIFDISDIGTEAPTP
jgi:Phage capsid family